jgi:hypothetical protein
VVEATRCEFLRKTNTGQSQATLVAKQRDLQRFLSFYQHLYGHDRPANNPVFVCVTGQHQ